MILFCIVGYCLGIVVLFCILVCCLGMMVFFCVLVCWFVLLLVGLGCCFLVRRIFDFFFELEDKDDDFRLVFWEDVFDCVGGIVCSLSDSKIMEEFWCDMLCGW